MANIALGKLPLEPNWKRPEIATDGKITGYTGYEGFSHADWPTTYTLDLEREIPIHEIRFLLWDNKGRPTNAEATRQYYYTLAISNDNVGWQIYFSTGSKGFIGWQIFELRHKPRARFVRLSCHHNTEQPDFHIVEFEVHDSKPSFVIPADRVKNHQVYFNESKVHFDEKYLEKYFKELTTTNIETREKELSDLADKYKTQLDQNDKLKKELESKTQAIDSAIVKVQLIERGLGFSDEARKNTKASSLWLAAAITSFVCLIILLYNLYHSTEYHYDAIFRAIQQCPSVPVDSTTLWFEFISFLAVKVILISIIIYTISFCTKNFRSQRHNYTVNKHKAMSLSTSLELLSVEKIADTTKQSIFSQAIMAIYSHQNSGYEEKGNESNPNVVASVIEKATSN